jgi:hypothetical protein
MGTNTSRIFLASMRSIYSQKMKPKARNQLVMFPREVSYVFEATKYVYEALFIHTFTLPKMYFFNNYSPVLLLHTAVQTSRPVFFHIISFQYDINIARIYALIIIDIRRTLTRWYGLVSFNLYVVCCYSLNNGSTNSTLFLTCFGNQRRPSACYEDA